MLPTLLLNISKFSRMSRYDITGIGINIREVPDNNGGETLKVLGVILDGPAHAAGVRQVFVDLVNAGYQCQIYVMNIMSCFS